MWESIGHCIAVAFIRALVYCMDFERTVGVSTGMNPKHTSKLREEIVEWEGHLHRLLVNRAV